MARNVVMHAGQRATTGLRLIGTFKVCSHDGQSIISVGEETSGVESCFSRIVGAGSTFESFPGFSIDVEHAGQVILS